MSKAINYGIATALCFPAAWAFAQPPLSWWWMGIVMVIMGIAFLTGTITSIFGGE